MKTSQLIAEHPGPAPRFARLRAWAVGTRRSTMFILGFVPILLIGVLNYHTSPHLSSSFFYLLPILLITNYLGRSAGVVGAIVATALWFWADVTGASIFKSALMPSLNAVMRLGVFLIVVWLLSGMRSLMDSLEMRVDLRTAELLRESAERRELERRILEVSEREQARIGQDLHDGLCQHLVGTAFSANMLLQRLAAKNHVEVPAVEKLTEMLDDSITQARRLARGLYPVRIEEMGLSTALQEIAENVQGMYHVECGFTQCGDPGDVGQPAAVHLYRIAQEAVANAVKHSRSTWINIELRSIPHGLELIVADNGEGIRQNCFTAEGLGLRIMEFRARMIGATFEVIGRERGGTEVRCVMPFPANAEQFSD